MTDDPAGHRREWNGILRSPMATPSPRSHRQYTLSFTSSPLASSSYNIYLDGVILPSALTRHAVVQARFWHHHHKYTTWQLAGRRASLTDFRLQEHHQASHTDLSRIKEIYQDSIRTFQTTIQLYVELCAEARQARLYASFSGQCRWKILKYPKFRQESPRI